MIRNYLPLVLCFLTIAVNGPATLYAEGQWIEIGMHPQAVKQRTAWGKTIQRMTSFNGRIYLGYGDWNANTGPISITSLDPVTQKFSSEWISMTECVSNYRPISGRLFAPAIDPRGGPPKAAGYAVGDSQGKWNDNPVFMEHAFDMATLTGDDLWLVGSYGDYHSMALRSLDGGRTWKKSLDLFRAGDTMSRFYFVFELNRKLYVQSSSDINSMVFDGTTWAAGPQITRLGHHSESFAGKIILQSGIGVGPRGDADCGQLLVFDGIHNALPIPLDTPVWNFSVNGNTLYVLQANMLIKCTRDLINWATVATAPVNSRSLVVSANRLYIGTTDSKIYEYEDLMNMSPSVKK